MLGEKVVGSPCHLLGVQYAQMIQLHAPSFVTPNAGVNRVCIALAITPV